MIKLIKYSGVEKTFSRKNVRAITEASFTIEKGEFVFFMGESGAGKSTLLKMLYKEIQPSRGEIIVFGRNIKRLTKTRLRRNIGVVFQSFELLPNKSALENVSYVLECYGHSPFKASRKAKETLAMLGLEGKEKQLPNELSGGEQQRVVIARAIVNNPKILICDEPTGNLDDDNAYNVMKYLQKINDAGTTVLMATHNKEIVRQSKKRIILVENGKIIDKTYQNKISLADFITVDGEGVV